MQILEQCVFSSARLHYIPKYSHYHYTQVKRICPEDQKLCKGRNRTLTYPSSFHSHPCLPHPGPRPSSQEVCLRTHCIWGSGTPSWSHPYIRVQSGAAQLRAKEESNRISTDSHESPLSRPPTTSS